MKTLFPIFILICLTTQAQTLREESRVSVVTSQGDEVNLYAATECHHCYYYLPTSLRIAVREGAPEISFISWNSEETSMPAGGVLHFLVEWGLKRGVEKEVRDILRTEHDSLAVVMGPVLVEANEETPVLEGKDKLFDALARSLQNDPALPTTPGAKMAFSFRFTKESIGDFLDYVNNAHSSKTYIRLAYGYAAIDASGRKRDMAVVLRLPFSDILPFVQP